MRKLIPIILIILGLPLAASAQLNTHGGGTGVVDIAAGSIPFGSVFNIRIATSSDFQFSNSASRLTFKYGSSTAVFSAPTICLTGDVCRTSWPGGGVPLATTSFAATAPLQIATSPLITYSILAASASQAGSMSAGDFQLLHTATTTFTSPLIYTLGTNAVTCQVATGSVPGCLSAADWTTFNSKSGFAFPFTTNAATLFFNAISNSTTTQIHLSGTPVSLSASSTSQFDTSTTTAATIKTLYLPNQTSALLLTGATPGLVGSYGGASACSANNFVTTISGVGGTTCGTAAISGVNLGSNLNAHTVSGSITGTSYNGSAAVSDWTLNMANANTFTATQTFKSASSTNLSASGYLGIPTVTALQASAAANSVAINTTGASSSIQFGSSQALYATTSASFTWSTTSPSVNATDTIMIMNGPRGVKFDNIACRNIGGAAATTTIAIGTGVATSTYVQGTTNTPTFTTLTTNNSFNSLQTIFIAIGSYSYLGISQVSCGFGKEYTY